MAELTLAGVRLQLDHRGGLVWPEERLLAVADLHLEKGSAFASRGQMLPPYDSALTLSKLSQLLARHRPKRLVLLGDTFHDRGAHARMDATIRDSLQAIASTVDCVWIAGNHDPETPEELPGEKCDTLRVGPLLFRHAPEKNALPGEIAGHLHPVAKVVTERGRIRRRTFVCDGTRLLLPAFGAYAGGLNLCDPAVADLFNPARLMAHVCGTTRVFAVPPQRLAGD